MNINKKTKVAGPGNKSGPQTAGDQLQTDKEPDKLEQFKKFYKENNVVPEDEWRAFISACTRPLHLSFRFLEAYHLCPSHLDTMPGVASQAQVLMEYMKATYVDSLSKMTVDAKTNVKLEQIPWYPKGQAWTLNIARQQTEKYLGLKKFDSFLNTEKAAHNIQTVETWSMIPAVLLDVQPHHVILDMCAAPGFIASQICQQIHADPTMANCGLLILNDLFRVKDGMHFHLTQGTKVAFSNLDARKYPHLYLDDKKSLNNVVRYDRIVCDVKCSSDGIMRKNVNLQESWTMTYSLKLHSDQLATLRRALELVKVGGQVLYSTTSLNPVENEAVVMAMLKECEGAVELVDVRGRLNEFVVKPGMTTWKILGDGDVMLETYEEAGEEFTSSFPSSVFPPPIEEVVAFHTERCVRVLPHDNDTAGLFCAMFVKQEELSSVKAQTMQEIAEAQSKDEEEGEQQKEYGYSIALQTHVAVAAMEWTTETTDDDLETTSTSDTVSYPRPADEIDPLCEPTALVPGYHDMFAFCKQDTEEWLTIKEFFKISDDFDPRSLRRNYIKEFYQSTSLMRTILEYNKNVFKTNFSKGFGVGFFFEMPEMWFHLETKCPVMMSNEALALIYPYIGKQLVDINSNDLLLLAYQEKVKIDKLSAQAQSDISETDTGCILFIYRPQHITSVPACNVTFTGVRNDTYCTDFRDAKQKREEKHIFRLAGMERDDYSRKLQDDKLQSIIAKYKEEEGMDTA